MATLRMWGGLPVKGHDGEVYGCSWTPDGAFVLSAGWDGYLRLWQFSSCEPLSDLRASAKPLSACAISPSGRQFLAGSMEGQLTVWDGQSHQLQFQMMAHTRPIAALRYSPDGEWLATCSWDRQLCLRKLNNDRENRPLPGHTDIVAGCRFLPDGRSLLSWSHDATLRLWDLETNQCATTFKGHKDRVTAAGVAPDGRWAASGARDGEVLLWDLESRQQTGSTRLPTEVRGCYFLLDGRSLVTLDARGGANLYALPALQAEFQLTTREPLQCGELSPTGSQIALGCDDGRLRFLAIDGLEDQPLVVTATQNTRAIASRMGWLFGSAHPRRVFECVCPACLKPIEVRDQLPNDPTPCPHCRRALRYNKKTRPAAAPQA